MVQYLFMIYILKLVFIIFYINVNNYYLFDVNTVHDAMLFSQTYDYMK